MGRIPGSSRELRSSAPPAKPTFVHETHSRYKHALLMENTTIPVAPLCVHFSCGPCRRAASSCEVAASSRR